MPSDASYGAGVAVLPTGQSCGASLCHSLAGVLCDWQSGSRGHLQLPQGKDQKLPSATWTGSKGCHPISWQVQVRASPLASS